MNKYDIEECSKVAHDIWAHWMNHLFSQCGEEISTVGDRIGTTGRLIIPKEKVELWRRQMETEYANLTEKEKQSDREIAYDFFGCPRPVICDSCQNWYWHECEYNPQGSGARCALSLRPENNQCTKHKAK